jgi:hypothetical protein
MMKSQTRQRGRGRGLFIHIVPDVLWNSWNGQPEGQI